MTRHVGVPLMVAVTLGVFLASVAPAHAQGLGGQEDTWYRDIFSGLKAGLRPRGEETATASARILEAYRLGDWTTAKTRLSSLMERLQNEGTPEAQIARLAAVDFRGVIRLHEGWPADALRDHEHAVRELAKLGPAANEPLLAARNNAAVSLHLLGDYARAQALLTQVIDAPPGDAVLLGRALNNRGLVRQQLGLVELAFQDFARASVEAIHDRKLAVQVLNNQGRLVGLGPRPDVTAAVALLDRAQAEAKDLKDVPLEMNIVHSASEVLLAAGRHADALARLDPAVAQEAALPRAIRIQILTARGRALGRLQREAEALVALNAAVDAARWAKLEAAEREALQARGALHEASGRLADAVDDYRSAVRLIERTRALLPLETETGFLSVVERVYASLARAIVARCAPSCPTADADAALDALDRGRLAMLHHELLRSHPSIRDRDLQRLLTETRDALRQEAALVYHRHLAESQPAPPAKTLAQIDARLQQVRGEIHAALTRLSREWGERFSAYVTLDMRSFGPRRLVMPAGTLLVQYFAADDGLYVFLASGSRVEFRQNPGLTRRRLDALITAYRDEVQRVQRLKPPQRTVKSWSDWPVLRDLTVELHDALIGPIAREVASARHLVFAPSGRLHYLPLHALARPDPVTGDLRFLVQDTAVSYVTDRDSLERALSRAAAAQAGSAPLLALLDPRYTEDPDLGPLAHAAGELDGIKAGLAPGSEILVGPDATRAALLARLGSQGGARGRFGYLHLATHGVLDSRRSREAWLALDGANRLEASDIPGLDLNGVTLVTLSACDTAMGPENPDRMLMTLATQFAHASADSVAATLWPVDDKVSATLIGRFYSRLFARDPLNKARALQQAQIDLTSDEATRHPYFWAAFVLLGAWN